MSPRLWQDLSLRTRFALSVLLIVTAAVGLSGVIFYIASARAVERRAFASGDVLAGQISRNVDVYVGDVESFSRVIIGDGIILRRLDPSVLTALNLAPVSDGEVRYELLTVLLPQKSLQGIYIFARDGTLLYSTHGKAPRLGYAVEKEPWYAALRARSETEFLLWPTGDETTVFHNPTQVVSLVRPISYKRGQTYGYLKIDLKMAGFQGFLPASANAAQDSRILILDDEGRVIFDNTGKLTGQIVRDLRLANSAVGHGRMSWRGMDSIYAVQRSPFTGWTTWLLFPARSVDAELRQTARAVFLVGVVALVLMGLALYMLAGRVTRPLRVMAGVMRRVEDGDLAVRMPPVDTNDEVGRLSRGFNRMLDSLERLITQVFRAELREKDAQLLALQAQINPHFLYNTLNSIRALSRRDRSTSSAAAVDSLAKMLRYSISDWDRPAQLADELAHVQSYADIQKVRFGDSFSINYVVPSGLVDAQVVKLSLQPLVENALMHGMDGKEDALCVTVSAERRGPLLELRVADDGSGMDAGKLLALQQQLADVRDGSDLPMASVGIGIVNIDRRVKLLFGEQYGLVVESAPARGTVVTLVLPYVVAQSAPASEGLDGGLAR